MVIQRWQSLFLLIACALMACFSFMSLGQFQTADFSLNITTMGISYEGEPTGGAPSGYFLKTIYYFVLSLTATVLPFITIFLYKNLSAQRAACLAEVVLIVATIVCGTLIGYKTLDVAPGWSSIIIAPFLALILTCMAYNRIGRDRKLLRSADRIR